MYIRARTVPTNPSTAKQELVRSIFGSLTNVWFSTLTNDQRESWKTYSDNVTIVNTLGEPIKIGALPQYVRSNTSRIQAGMTRVDDAPAAFNIGEFTDPTLGVVDASAGTASVAFTNTDDWAGEAGSSMLLYFSRPQNSTINFFKGPFQYAGRINGAVSPPSSPATINLPFAVAAGQKVFMQVRVSRADGRLSSTFLQSGPVSA
jgi:hypothetical protein